MISLYASGVNGLSEFREHITNEILFGFVRVDDRFILITYVPDSISGVRRARALVHSRSVAEVLELSHAQITASSLSDISDANIRTRLKLGQNQVPNRPRSMTTKRTSVIARRRKSTQYPSPSPSPSPMSERNLKIITTEEPLSYDEPDRSMSVTPTPSTPTSVASSFAESSISTVMDNTFDLDAKRDATEAMLQLQLAKKKELEEARFRQFQRDQQEERFKRDQALKKFEQEEKEKQQQQETPSILKKPLLTRRSFTFKKIEEEEQVVPPVVLRKVVAPNTDIKRKSSTIVAPLVELKKVAPEALSYKYSKPAEPTKKEIKPEPVIEVAKKTPPPTIPVVVAKEEALEKVENVKADIKPEAKPLVKEVLMTGFASVQTNNSPFWKRRFFVMETGSLSIYKDETASAPISSINLSQVTRLAPVDEDEDTYVPHSFVINLQTGDTYQMFADEKKIAKKMYSTLQSQL